MPGAAKASADLSEPGTVRRNDPISHGQREIGREHDACLDHAPWSMGQSLHDPYPMLLFLVKAFSSVI
jgi:hypothetical protein